MRKYFYLKNEKKIGPLSLEKLSASDVNKDTLVWFQGLEDWTPMHQVKELKSILNSKPPPIPIGPPPITKVKSTEANFNSMIYLDKNGITIKASENAIIGEEYELNGEKYKVVYEKMLREMVKNEEDVTRVVTSYVLDMYNLFRKANRFNQNISHWDVENVASMKGMFARASSFNRDIKNWNVSNVINMSEMFNGADAFNQDISSWDVSNVLNMNLMFANTEAFNQDLSSWNVRKETTLVNIFKNTKSFKQDISSWNLDNSNRDLKRGKKNRTKARASLLLVFNMIILFLYCFMINSMYRDGDFEKVPWAERWSGNQYQEYDALKYFKDDISKNKWSQEYHGITPNEANNLTSVPLVYTMSYALGKEYSVGAILIAEFQVSFIPFGFEQDYYLKWGLDVGFESRYSLPEAFDIGFGEVIFYFFRRLFSLSSYALLLLYVWSTIRSVKILTAS